MFQGGGGGGGGERGRIMGWLKIIILIPTKLLRVTTCSPLS